MSDATLSVPTASAAAAAAPVPSPTDGQRAFWEDSLHAHQSSLLQTMLLHDDEAEADAMNRGEIEEIFAMCRIQPDWVVCEWAAGMGRLTPLLAQQSRFVYASDFVSAFCDANTQRCLDLNITNVQIDCLDASEYAPTPEGRPPHRSGLFDLCFVNWLLLYLDDAHAEKFLRAAKESLKDSIASVAAGSEAAASGKSSSGLIFLHESCWERPNESALFAALPAEERSRLLSTPCELTEDCKTYYRTSYWYENLFERVGLEVVQAHELKVYHNFGAGDDEEGEKKEAADTATGKPEEANHTPEQQEKEAASEADDFYNKQMCWLLRIKQ